MQQSYQPITWQQLRAFRQGDEPRTAEGEAERKKGVSVTWKGGGALLMWEVRGQNGDSNSAGVARVAFSSLTTDCVCVQVFHLAASRPNLDIFGGGCFLSCAHPNKSRQMEAELLFNSYHSLTCTWILFPLWCWIVDPFSTDFYCLFAKHAAQPQLAAPLWSETHFARQKVQQQPTHWHRASLCLVMKYTIWGWQVGL